MSPRPAAPWYVHPVEAPDAWQRLVAGCGLAFAVVNVDSGPGTAVDVDYAAVLRGGSATPLVGYVDAGYGERSLASLLREASDWRDWYGVTGIMLDQVPSEPRRGAWSLDVLDALRAAGCERVVVNPGVVPRPELVRYADVTCVFEGSARAYAGARFPGWLREQGAGRLWHLLHSCPEAAQPAALGLAGRRGASYAWATAGRLPNPWRRLQKEW